MKNLEVLSQKELENTLGGSEESYQSGVEFGQALKGAVDRFQVALFFRTLIKLL